MLAQRIQFDVLDQHHLAVVGAEQRVVDDLFQRQFIAVAEVLHGLGRAFRGVQQPFALRVFTEALENPTVVV
ncbi:hypothetical protein D3C72_2516730 [compost metagenome]